MHADDDDEYVPGSFDKLRRSCKNANALYIAKMRLKDSKTIVPPKDRIRLNEIGTPCGIIPFHSCGKSAWEYTYGGDFTYYHNLQNQLKRKPIFLKHVIYNVK